MHRNDLRDLLNDYCPNNNQEQVYKAQMLEFLNAHQDCFERSCQLGHFTGSCWLLNNNGDQALLLHHAKLDRWLQLGGHCDGDSDILAVAIKEAQEESGIHNIIPISHNIFDIDIHLIPQIKDEKSHYHYDVRFLLQVAGDDTVVSNRESKALKWCNKDAQQLPPVGESVLRMFNKWVAPNNDC